jgi:hypothetical protein
LLAKNMMFLEIKSPVTVSWSETCSSRIE